MMGPEIGVVENLRIKFALYKPTCTQRGEFTFMLEKSFTVSPVDEEEAGEAKAEDNN